MEWCPGLSGRTIAASIIAANVLFVAAQGAGVSAAATAPERGAATYREHCAVCHGNRGRGDGPAAKSMKMRPVDLTRLARPGEAFPSERVAGAIKGSASIAAHGVQGMMVWGAFFLANANGDEPEAAARIDELVRFIESIQVKK